MQLNEWLTSASSRLSAAGVTAHKLEAQVLAGHVMLVDRTWVLTHPEHQVNELALEGLLQRRESGEPLAYILGYREFFSRRFRVDSNVLIPRQETECLVEAALALPGDNMRVLDIGTGSGCIAITLKLERPTWEVWATDISSSALQVARENAETLGADITFRHSDLLAQLEGEKFDLIVSNPPYIGRDEVIPNEVRDYEPDSALFADSHGLALYQKLSRQILDHLNSGGLLILEIGQDQGSSVQKLFYGSTVLKDLSGNDRVVVWIFDDQQIH
jgi:release factor glutamine methyltransferase